MSMGFVDVNGTVISAKKWSDYTDDPNYGLFATYEGEHCRIEARWVGKVKDLSSSPKEFWTPFSIKWFNRYEDDGETVYTLDPVSTRQYPTVEEMIKAYRAVVRNVNATGEGISEKEIIATELDVVEGYSKETHKAMLMKDMAELAEVAEMAEMDVADGYEESGAW